MNKMIVFDKNTDYCSYFPDSAFGVEYGYGCYLHDRHYRNERKVRYSRKDADKLMRDVIYGSFIAEDKKIIGWIWSRMMYIGVRLFSRGFYN